MPRRHLLAVLAVLSPALLLGRPAEPPGVNVGAAVPNLTFMDTRYLPRSLDDFKDAKAFVLVFTNTNCPLVQRYLPVLTRMEAAYRERGVQFVAVNSGAEDSIRAVAAQAVAFDVPFPFVKDRDGSCARALGVTRTPEAVILDGQRRLRYRGRIDDQYRLGGHRPEPSRHDLREALNAVLAGRDVAVQETPVDGCLIPAPEAPRPPQEPVTFARHVAPLVYKHCAVCHRPDAPAFPLLTYRQVAAKANTLLEVITDGRMPPWFAAPDHDRHFSNVRALSAAERELFAQWVRSGTPLGDEKDLPQPPTFPATGQWRIGTPDLILSLPVDELPAEGDLDYRYNILPHFFAADTWVQGVQILPDNPRVVHHCNMAFGSLKDGFKEANFVTGQVPGGEPMDLADGVAFKIPKGTALALQIHYVTTGKPEKCQIKVGLRFAREKVQQQLRHVLLVDHRFAIPPGAPAHPVTAAKTLPCNAEAVGLFCHMHLRGKDMTFKAEYPDGTAETLLTIPNYNFGWQIPYRYAPGQKRLPKGTKLACVAHYDNSPFNPYNPDPKATVRDGPQSYNEMLNGFFFFTDADERLGLDVDPKTGHVLAKQ